MMKANAEIFHELLDEFSVISRRATPIAERRTAYAIQMSGTKLWVGHHSHYHEEPKEARTFEFMTTALAYATLSLGLEPGSFSVEAV